MLDLGGSFVELAPTRVVDTRKTGQGPCVAGERLVRLPASVPADAAGVVLNVTVTMPTAPGYLSVFADGSPRPATSSVNFGRGQTVANAVTTAVGPRGIRLFAPGGCPHVIVDLSGYFTGGDERTGGSFARVAPTRVIDTRKKSQGPCVAGERLVGLPASVPADATGVVLNVTVTKARAQGYLAVYADGAARPATSSVNFVKGQTVANAVTSAIGPDGLRLFTSSGCPHVIVDLVGYITGGAQSMAGSMVAVTPVRAYDTRKQANAPCVKGARLVQLPDVVPVDARSVTLNVTAVDPSAAGYLSVYADGTKRPATSSVNFGKYQTVANAVTARTGAGGIRVYASGGCPHVIVDVVGYYTSADQLIGGVRSFDAGARHTCAVHDSGTVSCWGAETAAPASPGNVLGDDRQRSAAVPVQVVGISDAVQVDVGENSACAIREDTTVTCWGWDLTGADDETRTGTLPVAVPGLTEIVDVTVEKRHACALDEDGAVWCWGAGAGLGQPGVTSQPVPAQVAGLDNVYELDGADEFTCAVHRVDVFSIAVSCWGIFGDVETERPPTVIDGVSDPAAVTAEGGYACALTEAGEVWCWGSIDAGVPVAPAAGGHAPERVDLEDVARIDAGRTAACAVHGDGTTSCFGTSDGLLPSDDDVPADESWTVPGLDGPLSDVAVGGDHGCVLYRQRTVECWGSNGRGELGDGTTTDSTTPVAVIAGTVAPASGDLFLYDSDPGYELGMSRSVLVTDATHEFSVTEAHGVLQVHVDKPLDYRSYVAAFSAPEGQALQPGPFPDAQGQSTKSPTKPGIRLGGEGDGCNAAAGEFHIRDLTRSRSGKVASFAADFAHSCDGNGTNFQRGTVQWNSQYAYPRPADTDGDSVPDTIDNCDSVDNLDQSDTDHDGAGDACDSEQTNTWLRFDTNPGGRFPIGVWYPVDSSFTVQPQFAADPSALEFLVNAGSFKSWRFELDTPGDALVPGTYLVVDDLSAAPGLRIFGTGQCAVAPGTSFVIHEYESGASGSTTRLSLDFEMQCEPEDEILIGSIRINATNP